MKVLELYDRASRVPVLGRGAFSLAFGLKAPYFLTIQPTLIELRPLNMRKIAADLVFTYLRNRTLSAGAEFTFNTVRASDATGS